ncbi:hypothetical protein CEXT_636801 [Caerostris extrusa]|uniref:Uncharacterized protein n=1 Tax=Caerostris extrusa TaxID=172846 RepID=A0AAV4Y898_CAEEX|nr:hypothetical protein CEXT_636801 [Caerostris extrusa]
MIRRDQNSINWPSSELGKRTEKFTGYLVWKTRLLHTDLLTEEWLALFPSGDFGFSAFSSTIFLSHGPNRDVAQVEISLKPSTIAKIGFFLVFQKKCFSSDRSGLITLSYPRGAAFSLRLLSSPKRKGSSVADRGD